jgi:hypothetical protein
MLLNFDDGSLNLTAEGYRLNFAKDRPFVDIYDRSNTRIAELFVLSSVHTLQGRDGTVQIGELATEQRADRVVISLEVSSTIWKKKVIRFTCFSERFTYTVEVTGQGEVEEVTLLGGYASNQVRWGSGFFWSGQGFTKGFNPEPGTEDSIYFPSSANASIDLMGVPLPGRGNWFFTPPPFCFAIQAGEQWLALGIEAGQKNSGFTGYHYHGRSGAFYLSLDYEGYTPVYGTWQLPALGFDFAADPLQALQAHVVAVSPRSEVTRPRKPDWWYEPIFCGWGAQCGLAGSEEEHLGAENRPAGVKNRPAPDFATQRNYEHFLETLVLNEIDPGTVVLDDKWQLTYGNNQVDRTKWPDLPGFIANQHAAGRKVLLWLKAWDPEGVPVGECMTNTAGLTVAVDPTNPAFERRLRESVRNMLSQDGLGADGFKIDFTARIPSGPGIKKYGKAWGLELMHLYLGIIYDEAKRVKPDSLVITHTPNPFLADVVDAIRLNDIISDTPVCESMSLRAQVASIACPDALIDSDDWPMPNRVAWREYLERKPVLGVPALYFTDRIDTTHEPLTREDYTHIRLVWEKYRARLLLQGVRTRAYNQLVENGIPGRDQKHNLQSNSS